MKPSELLVICWVKSALLYVFWNSGENPRRFETVEGETSWKFTFYPRTHTCVLSGRGPDGIVGWKFESLHKMLEFLNYHTDLNTIWNTDGN